MQINARKNAADENYSKLAKPAICSVGQKQKYRAECFNIQGPRGTIDFKIIKHKILKELTYMARKAHKVEYCPQDEKTNHHRGEYPKEAPNKELHGNWHQPA